MDWEHPEKDWEQIRVRLRARWAKLTEDDLDAIAGQRERLLGRLRQAYGLTSERAEAELRNWERHQEPIEPMATAT